MASSCSTSQAKSILLHTTSHDPPKTVDITPQHLRTLSPIERLALEEEMQMLILQHQIQ